MAELKTYKNSAFFKSAGANSKVLGRRKPYNCLRTFNWFCFRVQFSVLCYNKKSIYIYIYIFFFGWGEAYGVTKYRNTDNFFLKILIYRRIFSEIPMLKLFSVSQVFACVFWQQELNSFKI